MQKIELAECKEIDQEFRQLIAEVQAMIRGIRGAITIEADQPELVWSETAKLSTRSSKSK